MSVHTGKTDNKIFRIVFLYFQEFSVIDDGADHFVHIVRFVRAVGDDLVQQVVHTVDGVGTVHQWSFFQVVLRNKAEKLANNRQTFFTGFGSEVSYTGLAGMYACTTQIFLRHVFTRYCFHNSRSGEEHVRCTFRHQREVRQGGRVNRTRTENT